MRKALIFLIIFKVWLVLIFNSNNASEIKITNARCTILNKTWISVDLCRLKAINRYKTIFNANITVFYPVHQVSVNARFLQRTNGYKPWLYNITVDLCRFLRRPYNPIAIAVIRRIREFTSFNHTCPYVGKQYVRDLHVKYNKRGLAFPTGEYLLKIDWFFYGRRQALSDFYFSVKEDITAD